MVNCLEENKSDERKLKTSEYNVHSKFFYVLKQNIYLPKFIIEGELNYLYRKLLYLLLHLSIILN